MSRKPVDKLRPDETRQAIWEIIRRDQIVTANRVKKEVLLSLDTVRDYLHGLTAAGHLERVQENTTWTYRLVKDNGQEAPRVRKDGTPVLQGLAREQMWRALGIFAQKGKAFAVRDLTFFASTADIPVAESDAKSYCQHLHHSGYLVLVKPGSGGKPNTYKMLLKMWTGPKPVQVQRTRRCYDPNTGAAAHVSVLSVEGGE